MGKAENGFHKPEKSSGHKCSSCAFSPILQSAFLRSVCSNASELKIGSFLSSLRGKTRAEGCFRLRFEMRWRVTEAERYQELPPDDRRCKAQAFSAKNGEPVWKGIEGVWARHTDEGWRVTVDNRQGLGFKTSSSARADMWKFLSALPSSGCLHTGPTHVPNVATHVSMLVPQVLPSDYFLSSRGQNRTDNIYFTVWCFRWFWKQTSDSKEIFSLVSHDNDRKQRYLEIEKKG